MPDYPFTICSILGAIITIPSAYVNWKIPSRPWALQIFTLWIICINLIYFTNSLIWPNADNPDSWWDGEVYCDVIGRITDMFTIGVPGAAIGVCRFLADATDPDPGRADIKTSYYRRNAIDLFLGVVFPLLLLPLKFLASPHRYFIFDVTGCFIGVSETWVGLMTYHIWIPFLSLIAGIYACIFPLKGGLTVGKFLRNWYIRRKRLNESWSVNSHNSHNSRNGISKPEFVRLTLTGVSVIIVYVPLSLAALVLAYPSGLFPYSWSQTHGPSWNYIIKIASGA